MSYSFSNSRRFIISVNGKDTYKFFATPSAKHIIFLNYIYYTLRNISQNQITNIMSIRIVKYPEMINIHKK